MPVVRFEDHFKQQRMYATEEVGPRLRAAPDQDDDEEDAEQPGPSDQVGLARRRLLLPARCPQRNQDSAQTHSPESKISAATVS